MSNQLLFETFVYGNLELVYKNKKIRTFKLDDFINILRENNDTDLGYFWGWRYYKNLKILLSLYESNIYQCPQQLIKFITLAREIFNIGEKIYDLHHIDSIVIYKEELAFFFIYKELKEKINFVCQYSLNSNITNIKKEFDNAFSDYNLKYYNKLALCNYLLPYEENSWLPSWSVTFDQEQDIIEGVDLYFDYYFKYPDIRFNLHLSADINFLLDRIEYLKEKAPLYYQDYIANKIGKLSRNIFYSFPYKLIYQDYYRWLENDKVFRPALLKYLSLDKINEDIWLLAILPRYLTAYLLGYPILSSDVPGDKNLQKNIETIINSGLTEYWQGVYKNNQAIMKLKRMGIDCANHIDEGSIVDLIYNPVEKYNIDDTLLFFNEGVCHIFTYPEFNDIINKERNPYNRSNIPLLTPLVAALKLKKKIKRQLNYRYLDIELNYNIEDNFFHIKNKISGEIDFSMQGNIGNLSNTFFNLFFNNN